MDADQSKHEELISSKLKSDHGPTAEEHLDFSSVLLMSQPRFGSYVTEQADFAFWLKQSTGRCTPAVLDRGGRGPPCSRCRNGGGAETEAVVVVDSLASPRRRSSSHEWEDVFFEMKMRLRFDDAWACYFTFSPLQMQEDLR